jgi:uncharacterized phiE125 gp8 family phage protein
MVDLETLVAPVAEPVSLPEAKAWLRIGTDGDDAVLTAMIAAARARFEAETGRALIVRTVRERFTPLPRAAPDGSVRLLPALGPVVALVSAVVIGPAGVETPAPAGLITITGRALRLAHRVDGLVVTYTAGAASGEPVAMADKVAVLDILSALHAHRDQPDSRALKREPLL